MPAPTPPLPTFIIIGAQKSATRWLRHNLGLHPDIFAATQEVKFFNHPERVARLGPAWYRSQFGGWRGEPIIGEATPGYLMLRHRPADVAARIRQTVPDVRLIALLRNPVDRAGSALVHHLRQGRIRPGTRLLDKVRSEHPEEDWLGLVSGGWYAASLEPYLRVFGDQLLVMLHDDIRSEPRAVFTRALDHVGASTPFFPPSLEEVRASNQKGAPGGSAALSFDDRAELFAYFRDDVERLEGLLGRDLSIWKPDRSSETTDPVVAHGEGR